MPSTSKGAAVPVVKKPIVKPNRADDGTNIPFHSIGVIFVYFSCTTLQWIFISPWYVRTYRESISVPVLIAFAITTLTTLVNFSYASFMNPGFLPKSPDARYLKKQASTMNVNGVEIKLKHCRTCQYYRMARTVHCSTCDRCVDTFDHHCPWVNNCIGRRNYRFFFMFLICVTSHLLFSTIFCIWALLHQPNVTRPFNPMSVETTSAFIVAAVAGGIFFPVAGLLGFHIFLISKGRTTYEHVTKKYPQASPFDMGSCHNYVFLLCGPEFPVFKSPSTSGKPIENDGSQEVQPALIAKFRQSGMTNASDYAPPKFPLRKTERIDNLAEDSADSNDNISVTGVLHEDPSLETKEDEICINLEDVSEQSFLEKELQSNVSVKVLSPEECKIVAHIANESGELLCTMPTEISMEDGDGNIVYEAIY